AQRRCEATAIALSLFYRDDGGRPVRADQGRTAPNFPEPQPPLSEKVNDDIRLALWQRPELRRLELQRRQAEGDLCEGSAQTSNSGLRTAALNLSQGRVPLPNGDARTRVESAQETLARLRAQETYQRDLITAQVHEAMSAMVRTQELIRQARDNVTLTRRLA